MIIEVKDEKPTVRCAIYIRPIRNICRGLAEHQFAICNDEISNQGWLAIAEYVVIEHCDASIPIAQRPGLQLLIQSTKLDPKPFDRIVIADSFYIARKSVELLSVQEETSLHGVSIYIAGRQLDLGEPWAPVLLSISNVYDAHYRQVHGRAISEGIQRKTMERNRTTEGIEDNIVVESTRVD